MMNSSVGFLRFGVEARDSGCTEQAFLRRLGKAATTLRRSRANQNVAQTA